MDDDTEEGAKTTTRTWRPKDTSAERGTAQTIRSPLLQKQYLPLKGTRNA
ncbi:hypothetical protein EVA_07062 [gut metagenome]|uniref:Uncharacterized protein n=1 Tax=gut metagenome TaxID=749906 RepID=J9GD80_9ZZZZ